MPGGKIKDQQNNSSLDVRNFFNPLATQFSKSSRTPTAFDQGQGGKRKNDSSPSNLRLESKIDQILAHLDNRMDRMETLVQTTVNHTNTNINNLMTNDYNKELRLNDLEQARLNSKMEISGHKIRDEAVKKNANFLRKYTLNFLNDFGHELSLIEISDVFYFEKQNRNEKIPIILVTFLDEGIKRRVMRAKLNEPPIFFSHVLTKSNKTLLMAAKKHARMRRIHSAWTAEGAVLIKQSENGRRVRVIDLDHLNELCLHEPMEHNDGDSPIISRMNRELDNFANNTSQPKQNWIKPVKIHTHANLQQSKLPFVSSSSSQSQPQPQFNSTPVRTNITQLPTQPGTESNHEHTTQTHQQ